MTGIIQRIVITISAIVLINVAVGAGGEIRFLKQEQAIWARGFPHSAPVTMDDILAEDRKQGWNVVSYAPDTDTYTLRASLWIGGTASWESTYFQLGRPLHEKETVIAHGNIWVRPPMKSQKRVDGRSGLINRLTMGDMDNPKIKAVLKIACENNQQYGIFVGDRDKDRGYVFGGELFVFNSVITAAVQDDKHRLLSGAGVWKGLNTGWYASRVELINATVSWIDGYVAYGIPEGGYRIAGCLFEHCGTVLAQNNQCGVSDCQFKQMTSAAIDADSIEFIRCSFTDNVGNWVLRNYMGKAVEMIDCEIGEPKKPPLLRKNLLDPKSLLRYGVPVYPLYIERKSCLVKITDENNNPLRGAIVSAQCRNDHYSSDAHLTAARNPVAVTGADGLTPARFEDGAISPAVRRLRATDDPANPIQDKLDFFLVVEAAGYQGIRIPLDVQKIGCLQVISLKKTRSPAGRE